MNDTMDAVFEDDSVEEAAQHEVRRPCLRCFAITIALRP